MAQPLALRRSVCLGEMTCRASGAQQARTNGPEVGSGEPSSSELQPHSKMLCILRLRAVVCEVSLEGDSTSGAAQQMLLPSRIGCRSKSDRRSKVQMASFRRASCARPEPVGSEEGGGTRRLQERSYSEMLQSSNGIKFTVPYALWSHTVCAPTSYRQHPFAMLHLSTEKLLTDRPRLQRLPSASRQRYRWLCSMARPATE